MKLSMIRESWLSCNLKKSIGSFVILFVAYKVRMFILCRECVRKGVRLTSKSPIGSEYWAKVNLRHKKDDGLFVEKKNMGRDVS